MSPLGPLTPPPYPLGACVMLPSGRRGVVTRLLAGGLVLVQMSWPDEGATTVPAGVLRRDESGHAS